MLIKDEVIEKIKSGEITMLFRRWSRPGAKAGGTQMTQGGVVGIDSVEIVTEDEITDLDARLAIRRGRNYCPALAIATIRSIALAFTSKATTRASRSVNTPT